jgi:hypothetical protein
VSWIPIKATAAQTGGLFGLKESKAPRGSGPPFHVHEHEDEACYVLEGEVTFFVGKMSSRHPRVPGSPAETNPTFSRIESVEAKTLWLVVPGGFESFFVDTFPAAVEGGSPPKKRRTSDRWRKRLRDTTSRSLSLRQVRSHRDGSKGRQRRQ